MPRGRPKKQQENQQYGGRLTKGARYSYGGTVFTREKIVEVDRAARDWLVSTGAFVDVLVEDIEEPPAEPRLRVRKDGSLLDTGAKYVGSDSDDEIPEDVRDETTAGAVEA